MNRSMLVRILNKYKRDGLVLTIKDVYSLLFVKKEKIKPLEAFPFLEKRGLVVSHVSAFNFGNMGDTYLPVIMKNLVNAEIPVKKWTDIRVETEVTNKVVSMINKSAMCLIGGGGLFLRDTHPNDVSGWQWNCCIQELEKIQVPIIVFAVGYNRFRNQEDFKPIFTEHVNALVQKASFIGLRNHGSIECIKKYLKTDELKNKLVFQPCMTTLTSLIYPNLVDYDKKEPIIALNCAFDRSDRRCINENTLSSIANAMTHLSKEARILVVGHMASDFKICDTLNINKLEYEKVLFSDVEQMISIYAKCRLVIGMRGHAQMIPFGCNTPILSIVSHDKMNWFLEDIHHPEWGVEINNPNFETELVAKASQIYANYQSVVKEILEEQQKLYNITKNNLQAIRKIVKNCS